MTSDLATKARKAAEWIAGLGNTRNVVPVIFSIRRTKKENDVFPGCRYTWVGQYGATMSAVTQGRALLGAEYTRSLFYLVGRLPDYYRRDIHVGGYFETRFIYRIPGDPTGDWFVSGYYNGQNPERFAAYHPFGPNIALARSERSDGLFSPADKRMYPEVTITEVPLEVEEAKESGR